MTNLTHKKTITMHKGRLEAFSDGVLAIIITIMVLELKIPRTDDLYELLPLLPIFLSYFLSFIYVGIYWNNHHHIFQIVKHVNGKILWANLNLLFWLSLLPFATAWSGENSFSRTPVAMYGFILLMASVSFYILAKSLASSHGSDSDIAKSLGNNLKGKISIVLYAFAIIITYYSSYISMLIYLFVAILWIIPDKRVENMVQE